MKQKIDYSRLINLPPLSPTEAHKLVEIFDGTLEMLGNKATPSERELMTALIGTIELQLRLIKWPVPADRKAPYPP
jgi:hypothetical protein